ncbi:cation efflux protein [Coemansia reversa NRRL 1564]|uniref:Cation efflux protein n=1 Tax=Coemansia reversa (strain ATCC 12441 / NRRL 1564) TaxID=763665 RepID=A0A2G5BD04_COERN|nr:cation efflux protein [Coemansia reversa NRRL 1564]|eukprot:PIA16898.1 cation efflux protein [Coemansia reversa NRRL 1564]
MRWSTHDLAVLRDSASSFSSLSSVLGKEHKTGQHTHTHSHGLFSAHSHSHGVGSESASKAELIEHHQAGSRITLVGMGANIGMSVAKGIAGVYFHSSALLADAAHSLSDILGDLVTLYTFRKSRRPPDALHPFGYGRYEALGTLVVSAFLVAAGFGIGTHALEHIVHFIPDILAGAESVVPHELAESARDIVGAAVSSSDIVGGKVVVDPRAIWFAAGSIVINEALFQATKRVGERTKSNVLIANAWHHRSDAMTSLVSVGAIAGAIMGFPVLDAVGGLVVSAMLAKSGASMMADAVSEITDTPPSSQFTEEIILTLQDIVHQLPSVRSVTNVQCRKSGPFVHVRMCLQFSPADTAADVSRAVERVRMSLREKMSSVQNIDIDIGTAPDKS